jgi:hypothetical protein
MTCGGSWGTAPLILSLGTAWKPVLASTLTACFVSCVGVLRTPWPESASELYRPSYRRLSVKLVQTFADRGCHVVGVPDPYDRIIGFLDREWY